MKPIEVKSIKVTIPVKIGLLPPVADLKPGEKIEPVTICFNCNGVLLNAKLNGKSYRKALKNDAEAVAVIQGKLGHGEVLEAGIAVTPPPPPALPSSAVDNV